MKTIIENVWQSKRWFAVLGLFLSIGVAAQSQALEDSLRQEDQDIVSSIAPYSSDVRDAILDVSQYPQKIIKADRMQARTSQSFQDLIEKYPRDVQEKLYDMSRYPELLSQLTETGKAKSQSEVSAILSSYPKEVAADVNDLYPSHYSDLQSMNRIYQQSEATLNDILKSLPAQSQANFRKVISMPDVMKLLTDRIDLTVSLGEAYKNDPDGVRKNLADLNSQVTAQNAKDLEDYKQQVASDPELQNEMKKSSQEFADNYSETDDGNPQIVNNYYNTNPYPYWFGYPYWYPSAVWYPQPLYYHTGFYLGAGGNIVVVGLPSYAYSRWFFGYGYRRYPRLYNRYNVYYGYHYRPNINVYRGYNSAVRDHFSNRNRSSYAPTRGRNDDRTTYQNGTRYDSRNRNNTGRQSIGSQNSTGSRQQNYTRPQQNFRNSGNNPGNNFNSQRMNNFHSQQFHQQNWGGMRNSGQMRSGGFSGGGNNRTGTMNGGGGGGNRGGGGSGGRRGR